MIEYKEPELFFFRKTEDKETQSRLYELFKGVKKETIKHFNDPTLNTFFHQEKRQNEILYRYIVIRHMLNEDEFKSDNESPETPIEPEPVQAGFENVIPFVTFNFSNIIPSKYANTSKDTKSELDKKRNILTGKECPIFKSRNALYFVAHDEYNIQDILDSIE